MDDERKNDGAQALDFESQLAELIKQSGGVVPPKKKPEPAPEPTPEPAAAAASDDGKSPEEIEAEIEEMIIEMGGSVSGDNGDNADADFVMPDNDYADTQNFGFVMPDDEPTASPDKTPEDALDDIMAEIEKLERENAEHVATEATSAELDDELAEMLKNMTEESIPEPPMEPEPQPEQPVFSEPLFSRSESEPVFEEPKTEPKPDPEPEPQPLFSEPLFDLTREEEEKPEQKEQEVVARPEIVEPPIDKHQQKGRPIDVGHFDKVEPPKEEKQPDIAAMEAMLQQILNEDRSKKEEKDSAVVSEMEQMRAKIASLEYMLAQKDSEIRQRQQPQPQKSEEAEPKASRPTAKQILEQAAGGGVGGDINSMFKQWFDLEMAAKMKNIITEDEKKSKGATNAQQSPYDKTPAVVYNDADQGSSDFIKLSDNIYYNVREKKTYIMRELKPTVSAPAKPKPVKKKAPAKKPARPRRALRAHHARPGMRPHRPRRPAPPRRRP